MSPDTVRAGSPAERASATYKVANSLQSPRRVSNTFSALGTLATTSRRTLSCTQCVSSSAARAGLRSRPPTIRRAWAAMRGSRLWMSGSGWSQRSSALSRSPNRYGVACARSADSRMISRVSPTSRCRPPPPSPPASSTSNPVRSTPDNRTRRRATPASGRPSRTPAESAVTGTMSPGSGAALFRATRAVSPEILIGDLERGALHLVPHRARAQHYAPLSVDPVVDADAVRLVIDAEGAHRVEVRRSPHYRRRVERGAVGHDEG